jgi:hypothetical protein
LAVAELRDQGLSYAQVGSALGITRGRIAQLRGPDSTTEAAFFGGRHIAIATPLRQQPGGRPVVAQEDADAATVLTERLTALDLTVSSARIAVGGALDFTPDALVLICGPKTSPQVGELLRTDPALTFEERSGGAWTIREAGGGEEWAHSGDEDHAVDFAYLGRLRRPDGRPLLLIAGIHAVGSHGTASLLANPDELRALHQQTAGQAFSAVVRCSYEPASLRVEHTDLAHGPVLHGAAT